MDIEFIRGDTQFFRFQVKDGEGNPMQLKDGDRLYFTVKQNANSEDVLIQKDTQRILSIPMGILVLS